MSIYKILFNKNILIFLMFIYLIKINGLLLSGNAFLMQNVNTLYIKDELFFLTNVININVFRYVLMILVIFNILNVKKNIFYENKFTKINKFITFPIVMLYFLYIMILGCYSVYKKENVITYLDNPPKIQEITLGDLANDLDNISDGIIYIEREDCPFCIEASDILEDLSKNSSITIYKYNTIHDREENKEYLNEVLSMYSVDVVPTILILEDGVIKKIAKGEEINNIVLSYY